VGSATEEVVVNKFLVEARNVDGTHRFYPPGHHPATAKLREFLRRAKEIQTPIRRSMAALDVDLLIVEVELKIAQFEVQEQKAMRQYLEAIMSREMEDG
jgi:hypothetical protein